MTRAADFNIVWLPLRTEIAAMFNLQAARDFFFKMEGLPYGFHNFFYGWLDTPRSNLPPLMPNEFIPIVLAQAEKVIPEGVSRIFTEGLNMRMGTKGLNIP